MVCYSDKTKERAKKINKWISAIIIVLGLIVGIMGVLQTDFIPPPDKKYTGVDITMEASGFGVPMILLGLFCVVLGSLGCW
jgi:formate hydrogenlyase subunit 3/multisubunit Na+/H+ antiporter MnhD subunit